VDTGRHMPDAAWQATYRRKCVSPEKALSLVARGDRVFIGAGCGEPQVLVRTLTERGAGLSDTEVYHLLTLGTAPYTSPRFRGVFRHNSFFIGPDVRQDVAEGRADYTPVFLSEVPALFTNGHIAIDKSLVQLSPPDEHGFCSYGVAVDITKAATESAAVRIAQVNRHMPRTLGDSFIHVDELDAIVECDEPLLQPLGQEDDEVAREVGRQVAKLVDDGACLQIGIGSVPSAMVTFLEDRKDLGVHTEMFTDSVLPLLENGNITNARKSIHRDKLVASFCMGTPRLYNFIHDNPQCEFHPSEYVNDPFIIGKNERMVAVNGALEVDLTGQVCSDSLGYAFYSGIGGQMDFIRGAARSRGGRPVVCLASTTEDGDSRIVEHLSEGAGVVTTRGDVHYVVTEYGIAELHGHSIRDRATALIEVAHPDHRAELMTAAKNRHYVYTDQEPPRSKRYPDELERYITLRDGESVLLRPLKPTDDALCRDLFYDAGEETVYRRYMGSKQSYPRPERDKVVNVDYQDKMGIAAIVRRADRLEMVGLGEWEKDPKEPELAEVAFLIRDDWQQRGLGTRLLRYVIDLARNRGIHRFCAEVMAENSGMLHLFQRTDYPSHVSFDDGVYTVMINLDQPS